MNNGKNILNEKRNELPTKDKPIIIKQDDSNIQIQLIKIF
jgi:hypothetical protein